MKDIATAGSDITIVQKNSTQNRVGMKDIAVERISPV
jgi:hypothetical protein